MKKDCLICGKKAEKGEYMIDVYPKGKRLFSDVYVTFAWDVKFVHLDCIRPLPKDEKTN